jgi:arylsulfatase A-like enzyme
MIGLEIIDSEVFSGSSLCVILLESFSSNVLSDLLLLYEGISSMKAYRTSGSLITRRDLLKRGLQAGLAAALPANLWLNGCGKKRRGVKPSNVIMISIDTLRADHLGCYMYHRPTSPVLDEFASQGLLFENAATPCPWTLPAHASLLTGLYPSRHGARTRKNRLPDGVVTLAEVLRQHGFSTAGVVNSHWLSKKNGLHQGFDDFIYVEEYPGMIRSPKVEYDGLNWLSEHSGKPFLLFLHYYDIHSDYCSLPHYEKQFVRPYNGIADGSTTQLYDFRYGQLSPNQTDIEHLIDLYDASIRQMDDGLGRLFRLIEQKGLFNNTLVIVTSDHGEEFMEHGGVLHGRTYFQEIMHVPLVMRGPGLPQGQRVKEIVSLIDVIPTILALVGIAKPASLDGIDLYPLWQKSGVKPSLRLLFGEADWNNLVDNETVDDIKRAVRQQRYKLHYDRVLKEVELYDIVVDPGEKTNVASRHVGIVDSLFGSLKNFMRIEKTGETVPPLSPQEIEKLKSLGYL